MKIILVMSEASLWKASFVQNLIEYLPPKHKIRAAVLTSFKPAKIKRINHIKRYFIILGFKAFLILSLREIFHAIADKIDCIIKLKTPHSIAGVCRKYNIPTYFSRNVNDKKTIDWIKQFEPDILLCSGNQIFQRELLSIPKKGCINRHTSLLPAYAGIYPIFWCMLNDEKEVGVSVHIMEEKIDKGAVIAQQSIRVEPADTFFSLFEKCFALSVNVILDAIEKIDSGNWEPIINGRKPSYFSYPTWEDVHKFREKGKRIF